MNVRIEHCTVCWGYRTHALSLADALRKRFGATVNVVGGTLGQFDVRVDGTLVSSRGEHLLGRLKPPRLPDISDIVAAIEHQNSLAVGVVRTDTVCQNFSPDDAKRFYDYFGARQDLQFYEHTALKQLVAHADFEHASVVFEFGCGTGRFAEWLLKECLPGDSSYVGIDISTTMVEIASRRLAKWRGRATLQETDGTARLPYADHTCDRFVTTYVLDLLAEPAIHHVLSEAHRMLRPGGLLCVASLTEGVTTVSRVVSAIWKRVHAFNPRLVGGCRPLHLATSLDRAGWNIEHRDTVCSWGICSEIVIASPAG